MEDFMPKTCCIKIDPPTLVLFYVNEKGKLHRRSIPIREIKDNSSVDGIIQDLMKTHHGKYLKNIKKDQLNRLLKKLQDNVCNLGNASHSLEKSSNGVENEDFNKLDDKELDVVKDKMSEEFEKHQIKPGDPDWNYDVEIDFDDNGMNKIESGWDSEESDLEF